MSGMSGSVYYVYGGGRWRALDASEGSVAGWGGAALAVARRGRLQVLRHRGRVLAALRAHARGEPSAISDGPPLRRAESRSKSVGHCSCCQHNNNNRCERKWPPKLPPTNRSSTTDACIQTSQQPPARSRPSPASSQLPPPRIDPRSIRSQLPTSAKRPRPLSPTRTIGNKVATTAIVHSTPTERDGNITNRKSSVIPQKTDTVSGLSEKEKDAERSLDKIERDRTYSLPKRGLKGRFVRRNVKKLTPQKAITKKKMNEAPAKLKSMPKLECSDGETKSEQSESESDTSDTNYKETKVNSPKKPANKKPNLSLKRKHRDTDSLTETESSKESESQSILKKDYNTKYLRPRKVLRRDQPIRDRLRSSNVADEKPAPTNGSIDLFTQKSQISQRPRMLQNSQKDVFRELIISENDVVVLRRFLMRSDPHFDLLRYDSDDKYKAMFFYSINPLVNMERCAEIDKMLEDRSLQQFASQLGLRSVSEASSRPPPYKIRRRTNVAYRQSDSDNTDKENCVTAKNKASETKKESETKQMNHKIQRIRENKESTKHILSPSKVSRREVRLENLSLNGNSDLNGNRSHQRNKPDVSNKNHKNEAVDEKRHSLRNKSQSQDNISTNADKNDSTKQKDSPVQDTEHKLKMVPNNTETVRVKKRIRALSQVSVQNKEYSSLEDHAIVSWVSVGNRARLVNGNRVWRELETSYQAIVGRYRSWHSLRNRYLRHLLPGLGKLELPPKQQARLRADAAKGELKAKKLISRRNSIFPAPARGAFSRKIVLEDTIVRRSPRTPQTVSKIVRESDSISEPDSNSDPDSDRPKPRTPRYSDLTRRFADRHKVSSSLEFESPKSPSRKSQKSPAPSKSPQKTPETRSRKLFNPNNL